MFHRNCTLSRYREIPPLHFRIQQTAAVSGCRLSTARNLPLANFSYRLGLSLHFCGL